MEREGRFTFPGCGEINGEKSVATRGRQGNFLRRYQDGRFSIYTSKYIWKSFIALMEPKRRFTFER